MAGAGFRFENWLDDKGRPGGGVAFGNGFAISWQNGPLRQPLGTDDVASEPKAPNGAFVEDIIAVVIERIEHYQHTEFACDENAAALEHLYEAARCLDDRTKARQARGVEGTHER